MAATSSRSCWLDGTWKGYPLWAPPCHIDAVGTQGWHALNGELPLPLVVLWRSAVEHNVRWMADFTGKRCIAHAPHGKTTLSPQLFAMQLNGGAWGMSVATMKQVLLCTQWGIWKIILANQLVNPSDIALAVKLLEEYTSLELYFLLDSTAQLDIIVDAVRPLAMTRPLTALIELGYGGPTQSGHLGINLGRTGVRSMQAGIQLAQAAAASQIITVCGVECYEGLLVGGLDSKADEAAVSDLFAPLSQLLIECDSRGIFRGDRIIVSAGGSAIFDVVASKLVQFRSELRLSRPLLPILRSGSYLTHDNGDCFRKGSKIVERMSSASAGEPVSDFLLPALEVWAEIQSIPEAGLAIIAMGKRDVSFDKELPTPFAWLQRANCKRVIGDVVARFDPNQLLQRISPAHGRFEMIKIMDQHSWLVFNEGQVSLAVGDVIGFGISHPCTTFDKWKWMPLVDDAYYVTGAIQTYF